MRLTCVTDNSVERGSRLWGEHGLCFWVEADRENVLWDTGQTSSVLDHNLHVLGLDVRSVTALALSHAHCDHTGALRHVLEGHPGLPVYANASFFEARYSRSGDTTRAIGLQGHVKDWLAQDAFSLSDTPQYVTASVRTTGRIAPRPYPQGGSPQHLVERNGALLPDTYADDMSLVLVVRGGIVLLCGCCHAGLRNTLAALRAARSEPLLAVVGGTHLAEAPESETTALIDVLALEGAPRLYLNHCTGERAIHALFSAFGDRVSPCPSGTVIAFE
jgi:7,8-dihydropterin-6-yl-methyl-4-(beta-D-ribofuranosyl)aminobenzene 5'-phosphate synthase